VLTVPRTLECASDV